MLSEKKLFDLSWSSHVCYVLRCFSCNSTRPQSLSVMTAEVQVDVMTLWRQHSEQMENSDLEAMIRKKEPLINTENRFHQPGVFHHVSSVFMSKYLKEQLSQRFPVSSRMFFSRSVSSDPQKLLLLWYKTGRSRIIKSFYVLLALLVKDEMCRVIKSFSPVSS